MAGLSKRTRIFTTLLVILLVLLAAGVLLRQELAIPLSDGFDYPLGAGGSLTPSKDSDGYYLSQDFGGESYHLGEDWNGEAGGNTDLGDPVYAASIGKVSYAGWSGDGWGNVVVIQHRLPDGRRVATLYGHLQKILVHRWQEVGRRQQIGTMGNANGRYLAHLHFELRTDPSLGVGHGYDPDTTGYTDPSEFIDEQRNLRSP
jgi:murein DD-endopeptidase MepM/ murein hydrolase activator NlpD